MEPILVTGATGSTGGAVVRELLAHDVPVRAVVHRLDARSDALRAAGAQIAVADLFDTDQLATVMQGTARAYYCAPMHPLLIHSATAFMLAARHAKLEAIVGMSQWLAGAANPSVLTRQHWLADRLFAAMPDTAYTIVNPGYFADNYLAELIDVAAHFGIYPWAFGDSRNAPPSNEDIARVVAALLLAPTPHDGRTYRPTGPRLLDGDDVVTALSEVLGRRVRRIDISWPMFARAMNAEGFSRFEQLQIRSYVQEHRRGTFAFNAPTNDVFETTGGPAEPFEVTVRRYAALPHVQPTAANRLRALTKALRMAFTPAPDLDRFERTASLPVAAAPLLAIEDPRWRLEHSPASPWPALEELAR